MKKKTLKDQIAEDICELNCWRTPARIKRTLGTLTAREAHLIMDVLEAYVPEKEWIRVWKKQDMGKWDE